MPVSVSGTMADGLGTTKVVVQTGSELARSGCGTERSVRAAALWGIAGVERLPTVASAPAPAADFKNALRSMTLLPIGTAADFAVKRMLSPDRNLQVCSKSSQNELKSLP